METLTPNQKSVLRRALSSRLQDLAAKKKVFENSDVAMEINTEIDKEKEVIFKLDKQLLNPDTVVTIS